MQARLLVAVPLLILAEGPASVLTARLLKYLVESGIVTQQARPAFEAELRRVIRLRNASLPWIVIVAAVVSFSTLSEVAYHLHEIDWAGPTPEQIGFGGLWYLYVGRSLYLILALGWLGLLGHLREVCTGSGTGARVEASAVPLLTGARALAEKGFVPAGTRRSEKAVRPLVRLTASEVDFTLLCDDQTSGGLLIAISPDKASLLERELYSSSVPVHRIGVVTELAGVVEVTP